MFHLSNVEFEQYSIAVTLFNDGDIAGALTRFEAMRQDKMATASYGLFMVRKKYGLNFENNEQSRFFLQEAAHHKVPSAVVGVAVEQYRAFDTGLMRMSISVLRDVFCKHLLFRSRPEFNLPEMRNIAELPFNTGNKKLYFSLSKVLADGEVKMKNLCTFAANRREFDLVSQFYLEVSGMELVETQQIIEVNDEMPQNFIEFFNDYDIEGPLLGETRTRIRFWYSPMEMIGQLEFDHSSC